MLLIIAAGAAATKVKVGSMAGAVSVAVHESVVIAQDLSGPASSDLFSIASREGLALLIAVLFIGGILTRRIIITDPKAENALVAMNSSVDELSRIVHQNSDTGARLIERLDRIETKLVALERAIDGGT